jgi:hypothetical protein
MAEYLQVGNGNKLEMQSIKFCAVINMVKPFVFDLFFCTFIFKTTHRLKVATLIL